MGRASRLARTLDIKYAIETRACHAGGRGGRPAINVGKLARMGFIDAFPGNLLTVNPLFIQFVIDPTGALKDHPEMHPYPVNLELGARAFYFTIYRMIVRFIKKNLERNPEATSQSLQRMPLQTLKVLSPKIFDHEKQIPRRKFSARRLIDAFFVNPSPNETLLRRVSRMFIAFVVNPVDYLKKNLSFNPDQVLTGNDELLLFFLVYNKIIETLDTHVTEVERNLGRPLSTIERINLIYDLFQGHLK